MDLNLIGPQISPTAPAPDGPPNMSSMAKPTGSADGRDSFSSVLRSARQDNRASNQIQKREEQQPSAAGDAGTRGTQTKAASHRPSKSHDSQDHAPDAAPGISQDAKNTDSSDATQDDHATETHEICVDTATQGMAAALIQVPTVPEDATAQSVTPAPSFSVNLAQASPSLPATMDGRQTTTGTVLPALAAPSPATSPMMPPVTGAAVATTTTQPFQTQQAPPPSSAHVVADGGPEPALDPPQIPPQESSKTLNLNESDQQRAASPVVGSEPSSPQPSVLTAEPGSSPQDRGKEASIAGLVKLTDETAVHQMGELHDQQRAAAPTAASPREGLPKEETTQTSSPAQPHKWDAFEHSEKASDMSWSDRRENQHDHTDTSIPQAATGPTVSTQVTSTAQAGTTFALGNAGQPVPRAMDAHAAPAAIQAPPLTATHDVADAPIPAMSRSVVFEVAQPDLGRVNVRVAMSNDVVHTHLSSDRPDVGQYLMNGQDRLQAALQASGLDMGQFRVHIDRQGAQQGGQEWLSRGYDDRSQQQRGNPRQQDHAPDSSSNDRHNSGMLSLFA